jgi:hypothetical protein
MDLRPSPDWDPLCLLALKMDKIRLVISSFSKLLFEGLPANQL